MPDVRRWEPGDGEIEPRVKSTAARVIEALGTTSVAADPADRLRAAGADPSLAASAGALVPPGEPAVVEIVYPQYGGLTTAEASIMAVARQSWVADGRVQHRTATADLRLRRTGDEWEVHTIYPVERVPASMPPTPAGLATLVDHPNVELPDAAVMDLGAGIVETVLADALVELASRYQISVCVFRSGHPEHVFGTDRTSNHTLGRAVDVWAVDGRPVVEMDADDDTLVGFLQAGRDAGCDEIGGPVDLDGPGGAHFTDQVHQDHVHLGFRA